MCPCVCACVRVYVYVRVCVRANMHRRLSANRFACPSPSHLFVRPRACLSVRSLARPPGCPSIHPSLCVSARPRVLLCFGVSAVQIVLHSTLDRMYAGLPVLLVDRYVMWIAKTANCLILGYSATQVQRYQYVDAEGMQLGFGSL